MWISSAVRTCPCIPRLAHQPGRAAGYALPLNMYCCSKCSRRNALLQTVAGQLRTERLQGSLLQYKVLPDVHPSPTAQQNRSESSVSAHGTLPNLAKGRLPSCPSREHASCPRTGQLPQRVAAQRSECQWRRTAPSASGEGLFRVAAHHTTVMARYSRKAVLPCGASGSGQSSRANGVVSSGIAS